MLQIVYKRLKETVKGGYFSLQFWIQDMKNGANGVRGLYAVNSAEVDS